MLAAVAGAGPARAAGTRSTLDCPGNLLVDASFEDGFVARGRLVELVGRGWTAWYETLPGIDGINHVPAFDAVRRGRGPAGRVLHGQWSQEMATAHATHTAGLYQTVPVPPGSQVMARVWSYAWATRGSDPAVSVPPGTYALSVGLDPFGGSDPAARQIAWSAPITVTDTWLPLTVEAGILSGAATLFVRGEALARLQHNAARFDHACLRVMGPIGVPTPTASATPFPTWTPRPGAPTEVPNTATLAAAATELALDATATAARRVESRARTAIAAAGADATASARRAAAARPDVGDAMAAALEDDPFAADGGEPATTVALRALSEHAGWLVLVGALFAAGLALGAGRADAGGAP